MKLIKKYELNHIGYVVENLSISANLLKLTFGYQIETDEIVDSLQDVTVQFLSHNHLPRIEIVSPNSISSPAYNALKKGGAINHIGFTVNNIEIAIKDLEKKYFKLIKKPLPGAGHDNNLICFLYSKTIGLVELIEEKG